MGHRPLYQRLWSRIVKTETCWLWIGHTDHGGYGIIKQDFVRYRVHRLVYEMLVSPIPEDLTIDHLCRVRNCVNPDHLEAVSITVNVLRGYGWAGLHIRTQSCPNGHPYSKENTYTYRNRRYCKTCMRERTRQHNNAAYWREYRKKRKPNSKS